MYLLKNKDEKIIVDTVNDVKKFNLSLYEVYCLGRVDPDELVSDADIMDEIINVLKGKQMTKNEVLDYVNCVIDVPKTKISKVITKMKKQKLIYDVNDWNYMGERFIGMG